jgi:hypothetical protein
MQTRRLIFMTIMLAACTTVRPSSEQQAARSAWNSCPKTANIALVSIDGEGVIQYRAVSSALGARELAACLAASGARASATPALALAP